MKEKSRKDFLKLVGGLTKIKKDIKRHYKKGSIYQAKENYKMYKKYGGKSSYKFIIK